MNDNPIDRLVDWRAFEQFVRDLYSRDSNLVVEHDVTEVGKSGARRQTDVKVTVTAGGHDLVILIECKRWKDKVDRSRVDILAASVEDLNASKGVIFTTSGFEEGAEQYAAAKGIDLFVVRDLTDAEWGLPGRRVWFYLQYFNARIERPQPGPVTLIPIVSEPPKDLALRFEIGKDRGADEDLTLRSTRDGSRGPNLQDLLLEARAKVLALLASSVREPLDQGADVASRAWVVPVRLDLRELEHRQLHRPFGALRLDELSFDLLATVSQSLFEHDRGQRLDFALAVENYFTRQRRVVERGKDAETMGVHELAQTTDTPEDDVLQNGTVMQVFLEPWVDLGQLPKKALRVRPLTLKLPSWTIEQNASPEESQPQAG